MKSLGTSDSIRVPIFPSCPFTLWGGGVKCDCWEDDVAVVVPVVVVGDGPEGGLPV